ncbi:MAG: ATP-binding protein, partial [Calditrichaeota bacterium]
MRLHHRELQQVEELIHSWQPGTRLWIHVYGESGSGKSAFIDDIVQQFSTSHLLLFRYHFRVFPFRYSYTVPQLLQYLGSKFPQPLAEFLNGYPADLRQIISRTLQGDSPAPNPTTADPHFPARLMAHFLDFLSRRHPAVLVLEHFLSQNTPDEQRFLELLDKADALPLIIISSGNEPPTRLPADAHPIRLSRLSVQETEQLVARYLGTSPLNARLITNHLHIKSGGNRRTILFLLEAYYRPLLEELGETPIGGPSLRRLRIGSDPEQLFHQLFRQLPEAVQGLLAFLCRLENPFPVKQLQSALKKVGISPSTYRGLLKADMLREVTCFDQTYVIIPSGEWKAYLRRHTSQELGEHVLRALAPALRRYQGPLPVETSGLYFQIEEVDTALALAHAEAQMLRRNGDFRRALDRYGFLRRNLPRHPQKRLSLTGVLGEMGALQQQMGLYENAFESFREQRERIPPRRRSHWLRATARMAEALCLSDAFSEARYLLVQDLQTKGTAPPEVRLLAHILLGEMEQNFGHPDYALRHFRKAIPLVPRAQNGFLTWRLYTAMKDLYRQPGDERRYRETVSRMLEGLPPKDAFRQQIHLDFIKYCVQQGDFSTALPELITLMRSSRNHMTPLTAVQSRLLLAEVYGYFGKWHLSRSRLQEVLRYPLFIPNLRVHLQVLVGAGVVEKELGRYGAALEYLQEAHRLALLHGRRREAYEVQLHLGHIYLLVHSLPRARELLIQSYQWAREHAEEEVLIPAALFLSAYELQQERPESAREYLREAKEHLQVSNRRLDRLNYYYYLIQYHLAEENYPKAGQLVQTWEEESRGIAKFEMLAKWLSGKIAMHLGHIDEARGRLEEALHLCRR